MKNKILLFSSDPGGANTIMPLIKSMQEKNYKILLLGEGIALEKYKDRGFEGLSLKEFCKNINVEGLIKLLYTEKIDLIITATSTGWTEKNLWKAAENCNIPSFAILDQWINYGIRFSKYSFEELDKYEKDKNHEYLPTKVFVMDDYAKSKMIEEGIKSGRIVVTGQPHFDYLLEQKDEEFIGLVGQYKDAINVGEKDISVVYASEPITKMYGDSSYWGYTEKSNFLEIVKVLNKIQLDIGVRINIIIKLHPKESKNNYDQILKKCKKYNHNISYIIDKKSNPYVVISASDIVIGMSSMFLIESVILGKATLSVQIGLKRENPCILHHRGILETIVDNKELEKRITDTLIKHKKNNSFSVQQGAVENILKCVGECLCQRS